MGPLVPGRYPIQNSNSTDGSHVIQFNEKETTELMPVSHDQNSNNHGPTAIASSIGCVIFIAGAILCGTAKDQCDASLFDSWETPSCQVYNTGAIMMISTSASTALCLAFACCALSCLAVINAAK